MNKVRQTSVLLIDGEHYPPVTARAVRALRSTGEKPVLALMIGGTEKLGQVPLEIGVPIESPIDPERALLEALEVTGATRVIDLSDEPVVTNESRCRFASIALFMGATYEGADFTFRPPPRASRFGGPSVGIIGSGKRTGKTAIAVATARACKRAGLEPVIVAMGRGGPEDPELIEAGAKLDARRLVEWAEHGRHASSDYVEDALFTGATTVGAWRAGGGLAGATFFDNFPAALERANESGAEIALLEGSGAAVPPAHWDAGVLVVSAETDPSALCGYLGLFRLLLADLVVITMVETSADRERLADIESCILNRPLNRPEIVRTIFRPYPIGDVSGKRVWLATTAAKGAEVLAKHLSEKYGAKMTGISSNLADRDSLKADLESASADVLAVEVKAAGVDVAAKTALDRGMEVVFIDHRPQSVASETPVEDALTRVVAKATKRYETER